MKRSLGHVGLALAAVALAAVVSTGAGATTTRAPDPEHGYVLAIGDSLTAGTQPTGPQDIPFGSPAEEVNRSGHGYAEQLVASLRKEGMKVDLVNLACNRETTQTMIDGLGSLCTYPHKTQLAEALQFLHAHGKNTLAVVMSLGASDALFSCNPLDAVCYSNRLTTAAANLATILGALRVEAPSVPIATLNYADPFLAAWVIPALGGPPVAQLSVPLVAAPLEQFVQAAYAPFGVTIVDTQGLLQTDDFVDTVTIPTFGTVPVNVAAICTYTYTCTWGDLHPTTAGYGLIAHAFAKTLGFE